MSPDKLKEHIKNLQAQRTQAEQTWQALSGALSFAEQLLKEMESDVEPKSDSPVSSAGAKTG